MRNKDAALAVGVLQTLRRRLQAFYEAQRVRPVPDRIARLIDRLRGETQPVQDRTASSAGPTSDPGSVTSR